MRFLSLVHRVLGVLLGFFLFGGWPRTFLLGGLIVFFRWRRTGKCVRVRARAQHSVNALRAKFRETAPRFGHMVIHTVLVPVADFVSVVATEDSSEREGVQEDGDVPEDSTQGERPEDERTTWRDLI
ncbi:hypothetical protein EIP86_004821 [Pleurotus ostreatoroseus]|nr:hypothetical protein EIP86_004821 [Pleurotus ostreatoroseus]